MKELTIYRCNTCGNLICMLEDSGVVPVCCGQSMQKLSVNSTDASIEKHVPVIKAEDSQVRIYIGEITHPMLPDHHIEWIFLLTSQGFYCRSLKADEYPEAVFTVYPDETVLSAYAFCNLHGLWVKYGETVPQSSDTVSSRKGGLL